MLDSQPIVYQGQYGEFTINDSDRLEVIIYRLGLLLAGLSFSAGSILILWQGPIAPVLEVITPLFFIFAFALVVSLLTIHIYLSILRRVLQIFWSIGTVSAAFLTWHGDEPLALFVYDNPLSILGVGFIFAALTGIYFKEAFCFNRLETKFLTAIIPLLLIGHLFNFLPVNVEKFLLSVWLFLFIIFVFRKLIQPIPPDIGDKSVFTYLKNNS